MVIIMKKIMKKSKTRTRSRLFAVGLALIMTAASMLGGCGNKGVIQSDNSVGNSGWDEAGADGSDPSQTSSAEGTAMGRYLEEVTDLSGTLSGYRNAIFRRADGTLVLTDPQKQMQISEDNGASWAQDQRQWLDDILQDARYINDYAVGADGTVGILYYMETEDGEAAESWRDMEYAEALIVRADGTEIPVELTVPEEDEGPAHIWISDGGRIFVGTYGSNLYEIMEDGSSRLFLTLEDSPQIIQFQGNRMILDGYDYDGLLIYDLDAEEYVEDDVLSSFVKENYGDRTFNGGSWYDLYFFPGEDNVLYLAGEKGVYRHVMGGSAMEQIIDGSLSTFGNPTYPLLGMTALDNNEFMAIFKEGRLVRFVYDPTVPTVPEETIRAYSLKENNTLRRAISIYQTRNPQVYVNYEIGMSEDHSVTRDDALKKLNTEIMAGSGPDLLILDDMPVDAYIEKGLLQDIAPLLGGMYGDGELFGNVVDAYRQADGKIYDIPCEIGLPVVEGRAEYAADMENLADIADTIEKLRQDHPEKDLIAICSAKGIMKQFAPVCAPAWMTESGEIDREAVAEFLTLTKRIYDAQMDGLPDEKIRQYEESNQEYVEYYGEPYEELYWFGFATNEMDYVTGERQMMLGMLGSFYNYAEVTSVQQTDGFEDNVIVPMDGQCSDVFYAGTLAGINAASAHTAHAEGLLKVLLGTEDITGNGMPVNRAAFESGLVPDDLESPDAVYSSMAFIYEDGSFFSWNVYWFGEEQADVLRKWMETVKTPYMRNRVLEEAVYAAGTDYLKGDTGIEDAVAAVEKRMAIYLAE